MTTQTPETASMPIVDCDVHPMAPSTASFFPYLSQQWQGRFEANGLRTYARAKDRYNHPADTQRLDAYPDGGGPAGSDPAMTVEKHLDPYGIELALLLPQQVYGVTAWGDVDAANAFVTASNDFFVDTWLAADRRYGLGVTVSPHDPHAAAAEIRRHRDVPGVVAVQLLLMDRMMGDPWFDPIYEAACEAGLPIATHQSGSEGCFVSSQGPAGGVPRSYGERHSVLTQVGAANVVDAVVSGALERFPELQIMMVEWGFSWLPTVNNRMDLFWEMERSAMSHVTERPSEVIAQHFTFTTQPLDEVDPGIGHDALFDVPGLKEMLLFSSDYPHYDTDDPRFVLDSQIPESFRAAVCYENALRVMGSHAIRVA